MSTANQLRMHAGASDTHIPRPLLSRAADEIDALMQGLQNIELAAHSGLGSISEATPVGAEARKRFEKIALKARSHLQGEPAVNPLAAFQENAVFVDLLQAERDALAAQNRELVAAVEAALDYCSSEAIGTVQQEIEDNTRMQQTLRAALNYGR